MANTTSETFLNTTTIKSSIEQFQDNVTTAEIVCFSTLFFAIGTVGVLGNILVVYIVFSDAKMRLSMTNMLIVNLAVSDLSILLFGIPEIVQFMLNKGWLLGHEMCKIQRSVLVCALYASVMTLLALCVERWALFVFFIFWILFSKETKAREMFNSIQLYSNYPS